MITATPKPTNLPEFLEVMRTRGMMPRKSVSHISTMIFCYLYLSVNLNDISFYNNMRRFILKRLNVSLQADWSYAIEMLNNSEASSYESFWNHYDAFLKTNNAEQL